MLVNIPRQIPALSVMLADLGNPCPARIASALGVSVRSVQRWIARDQAPRPAALALFWVTRWGLSVVDCAAVNEAAALRGLLAAQRLERLGGVAPLRFDPVSQRWDAANDERGHDCPAQHNERLSCDCFRLG